MNAPSAIDDLVSEDFLVSFSTIATLTALAAALRRSKYVKNIEDGLTSGELSEAKIRIFVHEQMKELKSSELFKYDLTMAALAIALERRSSEFAEEYLNDLAQLKLAEMPMSIRVARDCLKNRTRLASAQIKVTDMTPINNYAEKPAS